MTADRHMMADLFYEPATTTPEHRFGILTRDPVFELSPRQPGLRALHGQPRLLAIGADPHGGLSVDGDVALTQSSAVGRRRTP